MAGVPAEMVPQRPAPQLWLALGRGICISIYIAGHTQGGQDNLDIDISCQCPSKPGCCLKGRGLGGLRVRGLAAACCWCARVVAALVLALAFSLSLAIYVSATQPRPIHATCSSLGSWSLSQSESESSALPPSQMFSWGRTGNKFRWTHSFCALRAASMSGPSPRGTQAAALCPSRSHHVRSELLKQARSSSVLA